MYIDEENPGGSFSVGNEPLKQYIRKYKQLGNHVKRYKFLKKQIENKDVIEFGCGNGAGALILSGIYKSYVGIDIDESAIKYAQKNIGSEQKNVRFITLDQYKQIEHPFKGDVIICYEVFEHVKDVNWLISTLRMLSNENGIIVLSTPNGLSSNGIKELYRSKFHVKEYTPLEFFNFLSEFGDVELYAERRKDNLDVKLLRRRLKIQEPNEDDSSKASVSLSLGIPSIFNIFHTFFNGERFWKIYKINQNSYMELTFSTTVALLKVKRF